VTVLCETGNNKGAAIIVYFIIATSAVIQTVCQNFIFSVKIFENS
jgi:hypothetical protein